MQTPDFNLSRNGFGKFVITLVDGTVYEGVMPVCVFPISATDEGLSLTSTDGRELAWITQLDALSTPMRALIETEFGARESISGTCMTTGVSTYATPSTWTVQTDRGQTDLVLRSEKDIHRLIGTTLPISDSYGIHHLTRDLFALDKHSRKTLDRFL